MENLGEFGLAERNVWLLSSKCSDGFSEARQREINLFGLSKVSVSIGVRLRVRVRVIRASGICTRVIIT